MTMSFVNITFRFLIILRISFLSKSIVISLSSVKKYLQDGRTLSLDNGVHWEEKKSLKRLAFL